MSTPTVDLYASSQPLRNTEEALTSQLLEFSAEDAELFSEAFLSTSEDVSSSDANPNPNPTTIAATGDTYSFDEALAAALSMDPAIISSLLDSQPPDPQPEGLIASINGSGGFITEQTMPVIQLEQFDQIMAEGCSNAYPVGATMLPSVYDEGCLMSSAMTGYLGLDSNSQSSCSFMDQGIGGLMFQGGMNVSPVCKGQAGIFNIGMGHEEVPVGIGMHYGLETLPHSYSAGSAELISQLNPSCDDISDFLFLSFSGVIKIQSSDSSETPIRNSASSAVERLKIIAQMDHCSSLVSFFNS